MGLFDFLKQKKTAKDYFESAVSKYKLQDYSGAKEEFSIAIELDPKYSIAYMNRGTINLDLKYYSEAKSDFDKVIELEPKNWEAYISRGKSNYENDYYQNAFRDLEEVIKNLPTNVEALELFKKLKLILNSEKEKNLHLLEPEKYYAKKFTAEEIEKELDMSGSHSDIKTTPIFGIRKALKKNIEAYDYYEKGLFQDGINSAKSAISNSKMQSGLKDIRDIEEHTSSRRGNSIYFNTLALGYFYIRDYDKALITINKCIEIDEIENSINQEHYATREKIKLKLYN